MITARMWSSRVMITITSVSPRSIRWVGRRIQADIVGTGGAGFYAIDKILPISEVRITRQFGIIQFEFFPDGYTWQFINVDGELLDQGSDACNPKPALSEVDQPDGS